VLLVGAEQVGVPAGDGPPPVPAPDLVDDDAVEVGNRLVIVGADTSAGGVELAEGLLDDVLGVVVPEEPSEPNQACSMREEQVGETALVYRRSPHLDSLHMRYTPGTA
jgi:hypothetical protein